MNKNITKNDLPLIKELEDLGQSLQQELTKYVIKRHTLRIFTSSQISSGTLISVEVEKIKPEKFKVFDGGFLAKYLQGQDVDTQFLLIFIHDIASKYNLHMDESGELSTPILPKGKIAGAISILTRAISEIYFQISESIVHRTSTFSTSSLLERGVSSSFENYLTLNLDPQKEEL